MAEITSFRFSTKTEGGTIVSGVGGAGSGGSTPSNVAYINVDNSFSVSQTFNNSITVSNDVNWLGTATGNGSGITDLNATQLTTGTINAARLPLNVAYTNAVNNFNVKQELDAGFVSGADSEIDGTLDVTGNTTIGEGSILTLTGNTDLTTQTLIAFDTVRNWQLQTVNNGASTRLQLVDSSGGKSFRVLDSFGGGTVDIFNGSITASGVITGDGSGITDVTAVNSTKLAGIDASNYLRLDSAAGIQEINNDILFSLAPEALKTISGNVELDIIGKVEADGNVISGGNVLASSGYMKTDAPAGNGTGGLAVNGGIASTTAQNFKVGNTHLISTTTYGWKGRVVALEIDGTTYSMMVANDDVATT